SGEAFSDFGTVFNAGDVFKTGGTAGCGLAGTCTLFDNSGLRASIGAGIVWSSPIGPLKFEYAYPLIQQPGDDAQWFRFSVGTRF
ncbi:MAG: BamA/TamA family outer membrane protein, partial [Alphaproteobacteria bacterium]|nr:BamA/TamA family outer membrane protein [Alphaproteobacteria bacterium]